MRPLDPSDLNSIVESSEMAPEDGRDWSHSSIPGRWWVPEIIAIEDNMLCWEPSMDAGRWVEPTPELLEQFLQIHQVEGWEQWHDAVLRFAQRWGPLHMCSEHVRPVWHRQDAWRLQAGSVNLPICRPGELADGRVAEPLWRWLSYAYLARDIVHAGALMRSDKSTPTSPREQHIHDMLMVKPRRDEVIAKVYGLIGDGMGVVVVPEWTSNDDVPVWRAEVRSLAAAVGVALWNALRGSPGVAFCAHCLRPFEIRQRNQRYCSQPACQTERKRVEKAQRRATQAASIAQDPEYTV